ncbi:MAG: OmpW family protein [Acetobacteraceae bacterium]|nr:OmpW family protein [Acetobacteraceae bacterium]
MKMKALAAATLAIGLVAGAAPGSAQETRLGAGQVRGKNAGDFVIGFGAIGVLPTNGGRVGLIGGTPTASNSASPQLDFSYFITPNIALNLIAASTQHDVSVRNSALGNVRLGSVWALPPTLTAQWHFLPRERISPYAGLGFNMTWFYGESGSLTPPVNRARIRPSAGIALNAGVDYELTPNWLLNFDVKWIMMQPDVSVNRGLIRATADINPFVVGASVRYRF